MIRKLDKENLDEIRDLIFQTTILYNTSNELKNDVQSKELFADFFKESFDDMELYGYFEEGKIIGVIGIENNDYIPVLYVLDKYQKKGIGTQLLDYALDNLSCESIYVDTNKKSLTFYEKYGFVVDEQKENKHSVVMRLRRKKYGK